MSGEAPGVEVHVACRAGVAGLADARLDAHLGQLAIAGILAVRQPQVLDPTTGLTAPAEPAQARPPRIEPVRSERGVAERGEHLGVAQPHDLLGLRALLRRYA